MGFLRRIIVGMVLVSLSLGGLSVAGYVVFDAIRISMAEEDRFRAPREVVRSVNVAPFEIGRADPVLTAFGDIVARRTLELRATGAGPVVWLEPQFKEGGRVIQGQPLLSIDPETAEANVRVAEADLAEAEADARDAVRGLVLARDDLAAAVEQADLRQSAFERQEDLTGRGIGTGAAVEDAALAASSARQAVVSRRQALASAEARLDQTATRVTRAEIALSEARRDLDDTTIYAPFDGTLSAVTLVEGGLVTTNEMLAHLVDPSSMEVAFRISTAQHARLLDSSGALIGLPVSATLEVAGLNVTATGVIDRESATVAEGQSGRLVFARLDNAAGLRPGDFVTVAISEPPLRGVAELPASALGADGTVLVLNAEERLDEAEVILMRRQGDSVLVRGDLAGRLVVAERTPLLGAGIKVRPIDPGTAREQPTGPAMVALEPERRAKLVAFVEGNTRIPGEVKTRILGQLAQDQVPASMVERLESRMGS
ncbi:MAG: HlyD family efflux transporter periplasmic adaptor subunit [Pseudomonadota bacterium]